MAGNGTLTRKQRLFVLALVDSTSVPEAAVKSGIAERTAWRYLGNPTVKVELAARQDAMLAQVTGGLVTDMTEARGVLKGIMNDDGVAPGVRVRAAGMVLDAGLRFFELLSLAQRVAELERRVAK